MKNILNTSGNDKDVKKNILIVHNYYRIAGGEDVVVANEKNMLLGHGHNVTVYKRDNNELNNMSRLKMCGLFFSTVYNKRTYKDIVRVIRENNIDIVHVHNTLNLVSPSVYYAAIKCNIPVVQTVHNYRLICPGATLYRNGHICEECIGKGLACALRYRCYRGSFAQTLVCALSTWIHRYRGIYKKINYICLTEFGRNKLLEANSKRLLFDEERFYIKPNFVNNNIAKIETAQMRKNYILYAGRLDETKGVDTLLKAWRDFGSHRPNDYDFEGGLNLVICGTGPLEEWCKEYMGKNNITNVVFKGKVDHDEVIRLMGEAKAMVLPTKWYEGFPMSIVEAFGVGTPVIGPDMGNVGSLIEDGINGYKYSCSDEMEELVSLITKIDQGVILSDEDIYRNCRELYKLKYSEEINYQILKDIYNRVAEKG